MSEKHRTWLRSELPTLVQEGVISEDTAGKLREYYSGDEEESHSLLLIIVGSVAALSTGAGCILLAAYNWPFLSRPARAAIALGPLVAAQAAAAFALPGGWASGVWREVSATFLVLAVGLALGLIGQTYHSDASLVGYGLWWLMLALPAIYLLRSRTASILYLAGLSGWGIMALNSSDAEAILWWPLAGAIAPYLIWDASLGLHRGPQVALRWIAMVAFAIGCIITAIWGSAPEVVPVVVCAVLVTALYLVGSCWLNGQHNPLRTPIRTSGGLGVAAFIVIFSFPETYGMGLHTGTSVFSLPPFWLATTVALLVGFYALAATTLRKLHCGAVLLSALPVALVLALEACLPAGGHTGARETGVAAAWCITAYGIVAAVATMADGVRFSSFYTLNAGMALLLLLMVFKFFTADLSLVTRGVGFTVLGGALFALNYLLARQMRET